MRRAFEIILIVGSGVLFSLLSINLPENKYELGFEDGRKAFMFLGQDQNPDTIFMSLALYGAFHGEQRRKGYMEGYIKASEEHFYKNGPTYLESPENKEPNVLVQKNPDVLIYEQILAEDGFRHPIPFPTH